MTKDLIKRIGIRSGEYLLVILATLLVGVGGGTLLGIFLNQFNIQIITSISNEIVLGLLFGIIILIGSNTAFYQHLKNENTPKTN